MGTRGEWRGGFFCISFLLRSCCKGGLNRPRAQISVVVSRAKVRILLASVWHIAIEHFKIKKILKLKLHGKWLQAGDSAQKTQHEIRLQLKVGKTFDREKFCGDKKWAREREIKPSTKNWVFGRENGEGGEKNIRKSVIREKDGWAHFSFPPPLI